MVGWIENTWIKKKETRCFSCTVSFFIKLLWFLLVHQFRTYRTDPYFYLICSTGHHSVTSRHFSGIRSGTFGSFMNRCHIGTDTHSCSRVWTSDPERSCFIGSVLTHLVAHGHLVRNSTKRELPRCKKPSINEMKWKQAIAKRRHNIKERMGFKLNWDWRSR